MRLEDIRIMVEKDLSLDETELDHASMRIPQIHGKYLNLLFDEKLLLKQREANYAITKRLKWEYYGGKLDKTKLDEMGWDGLNLIIKFFGLI